MTPITTGRERPATDVRGRRWITVIVAAVLAALVIGLALSLYSAAQAKVLMEQANALPPDEKRVATQQAILQFQAENLAKIWTTLVQAVAAVVLAIGGYFTWSNLRLARDTLEETRQKAAADHAANEANLTATNERLNVDREAQITNRFTQAIGQLGAVLTNGDPNLEVRMGGIYALERIARDSPRDYWTIMEILAAYLRSNAPAAVGISADSTPSPEVAEVTHPSTSVEEQHWSPTEGFPQRPKLRADVQAILTVIARRIVPSDRPEGTSLSLNLSRVNMSGAILEGANFFLINANRADLTAAYFPWADLKGMSLINANLAGADLSYADLRGATFLGANLTDADLSGAKLNNVNFSRATLCGALLGGADLSGAINLKADQVMSTSEWDSALLPQEILDEMGNLSTNVPTSS